MLKRVLPLIVVLLTGSTASATVTDFKIEPPEPIIGNNFTTTIVNDNQHPIASTKWEVRKTIGTCQTAWSASTGNFVIVTVSFPAKYEVRMTVTYGSRSGVPAPPPTTITKSVTVSGADAVKPLNLGEEVANGASFIVAVHTLGLKVADADAKSES